MKININEKEKKIKTVADLKAGDYFSVSKYKEVEIRKVVTIPESRNLHYTYINTDTHKVYPLGITLDKEDVVILYEAVSMDFKEL